MEYHKKYWWLLFLLPVVVYFLFKYYQARNEVNQSAARAREAKAEKAAIRKALEDQPVNGSEDAGTS